MPKLKTHSGLKKRIKVTGSGKLMKRRASVSHMLSKDRRIRKYAKKRDNFLSAGDRKNIKKMI